MQYGGLLGCSAVLGNASANRVSMSLGQMLNGAESGNKMTSTRLVDYDALPVEPLVYMRSRG